MVRTSMQELRLRPYHDLEGAISAPSGLVDPGHLRPSRRRRSARSGLAPA